MINIIGLKYSLCVFVIFSYVSYMLFCRIFFRNQLTLKSRGISHASGGTDRIKNLNEHLP